MLTAHPPPVPPDQVSDKSTVANHTSDDQGRPPRDPNLAKEGRQGTIKQSTTNKGYQQDR